jgi:hypothetical protein
MIEQEFWMFCTHFEGMAAIQLLSAHSWKCHKEQQFHISISGDFTCLLEI